MRHAQPDLVEVAQSFQVSRIQLARHVLIPGAIPFVVSGLRIGAERAIVGVIIGEMFLQIVGLGGFNGMLFRYMLKREGLEPEVDVQIVPVGGSSERAAAVNVRQQ